MVSRRLIGLALPCCLLLAGCASVGALAQPGYNISEATLQAAVTKRFPLRYPVAGLVNLDLQAPQLRLLPEQNRLGAAMVVVAAGPALRNSYTGSFDVDFALRFEASDRTLRATQIRVRKMELPGLRPDVANLVAGFGPAMAEQALREVVLHQLKPQDLALPDGLGLQPGAITVTDKGLRVELVPKPL